MKPCVCISPTALHHLVGPTPTTFDCSCFTGDYITGPVSDTYFENLKEKRSDEGKKKYMI